MNASILRICCNSLLTISLISLSLAIATANIENAELHQLLPTAEVPNFRLVTFARNNETVKQLHYRGRWCRELTSFAPAGHPGNLRLVTVTDGRHLVHNIYDSVDDQLIDCDVEAGKDRVHEFLREMQAAALPVLREIDLYAGNGTKFSYLTLRDARQEPLLQYGAIKHACRTFHHNHRDRQAMAPSTEPNLTPYVSGAGARVKRSLLISPGTQWCGAGANARHAYDFGASVATDRCCMEHDGCPYVIPGLTKRFGHFNYKFYTMSYCECDRRFYSCLKRANTGTSHVIGKVFFNVVNRSCFELKRTKLCEKYSFWGVCNRWKLGVQAEVKEVGRF